MRGAKECDLKPFYLRFVNVSSFSVARLTVRRWFTFTFKFVRIEKVRERCEKDDVQILGFFWILRHCFSSFVHLTQSPYLTTILLADLRAFIRPLRIR
uniref:Transthyretin-like family protein n=1 Tax=Parascaris univalens TaxID=6257 RepID=A0A914ZVE1_PARUN